MSHGLGIDKRALLATLLTAKLDLVSRPRPRAAPRLRLFCFPYAGGGSSAYHAWLGHLPAEVELCTVITPRVDDTPWMPRDLDTLLGLQLHAIAPYLDVPFSIFGHSMGALVGFELARRLRDDQAARLRTVFVSGCPEPRVIDRHPGFRHLGDGRLGALIARLEQPKLDACSDGDGLRQFQADIALLGAYAYAPRPALRCSLRAFHGRNDPLAPAAAMASWREQTSATFTLNGFPGGHMFVHSARDGVLDVILGDLERCLDLGSSAGDRFVAGA